MSDTIVDHDRKKIPLSAISWTYQDLPSWMEWGSFCELFCGVLTTSAFMVSAPCQLVVWTSLSSWTVPLGLSFFGLEKSDIMEERQNVTNYIWLKLLDPTIHM